MEDRQKKPNFELSSFLLLYMFFNQSTATARLTFPGKKLKFLFILIFPRKNGRF